MSSLSSPQGNCNASQWVHFHWHLVKKEDSVSTDEYLLDRSFHCVKQKKAFLYGKFFSFLDQRIFSVLISWNTRPIKHKSGHIHSESLIQRLLMAKIRSSYLTDITRRQISRRNPAFRWVHKGMNKRSHIVCLQRRKNFSFNLTWICYLSLGYLILFVPPLLFGI